jgi:circadian clock protein KaiC
MNQQAVVTMMVMAQHGFLGDWMRTPVDISYLADAVLWLRYFESEGAIHRALSVLKKRTGAHESTIREMEITPSGIRVGGALTEFRGILTGVPVYNGGTGSLQESFEQHD